MYACFEDHSLIFVFNLGCRIHFFYWNYILETVGKCKSEWSIKRHGTLFKRMCQLNKDRELNCFSFIFGLECLFIIRAKYTWLKSERVCSLKHLYYTLVDYLEWRDDRGNVSPRPVCSPSLPMSPPLLPICTSFRPTFSSFRPMFSSFRPMFSSFRLMFSSSRPMFSYSRPLFHSPRPMFSFVRLMFYVLIFSCYVLCSHFFVLCSYLLVQCSHLSVLCSDLSPLLCYNLVAIYSDLLVFCSDLLVLCSDLIVLCSNLPVLCSHILIFSFYVQISSSCVSPHLCYNISSPPPMFSFFSMFYSDSRRFDRRSDMLCNLMQVKYENNFNLRYNFP